MTTGGTLTDLSETIGSRKSIEGRGTVERGRGHAGNTGDKYLFADQVYVKQTANKWKKNQPSNYPANAGFFQNLLSQFACNLLGPANTGFFYSLLSHVIIISSLGKLQNLLK